MSSSLISSDFTVETHQNGFTINLQNRLKVNLIDCKDTIDMTRLRQADLQCQQKVNSGISDHFNKIHLSTVQQISFLLASRSIQFMA